MIGNLVYLYLLSPLHTGGITQEGNLLGIARESHTDLPYIPSSSIRGRLRASIDDDWTKLALFGVDLDDLKKDDLDGAKKKRKEELHQRYKAERGKELTQLEQGSLWVGDGSILWLPVPSLSHGVVWVTSPMLLQRWKRLQGETVDVPEYSSNLKNGKSVYLKDAILKDAILKEWDNWEEFIPKSNETTSMKRVLVLPDQHCSTLIQMSLWRQVKIKLDQHKTVDGGFRYEEAIPPDTLMYFPWGTVKAMKTDSNAQSSPEQELTTLLTSTSILQIGGQESLGRGFVQAWAHNRSNGNQPANQE
jgi:CRISPR-associated protein Cmr4